jgi:membrane associated rhomboid family serine protease
MYYQTRTVMPFGGTLTPAVKGLLIANVAGFVLQTLQQFRFNESFPLTMERVLGLVPVLFWNELFLWQVFTYQFLHAGLIHLLFNMLALWMFGCELEQRWGAPYFLKFYFVSVVGGALCNLIFLPTSAAHTIGASAGIYGLLMAYGLLYPERTIYFYFVFPMKMKHFIWIIGAITLFSSIAAAQSTISHLAHLGGMGFGYVYFRWGNPWTSIMSVYYQYKLKRLRRRLHVVRDEDDDKPTLH